MVSDVYAQCTSFRDCTSGIGPTLPGFSESGLFGQIISAILPIALGLAGFITVIFIIISGIQFLTAVGNPEKAAQARSRLTYALIGFIIVILAFVALQVIDRIFLGGTGIV